MKVTVTKPEKTKSWNPRDRYFWSVLISSVIYSVFAQVLRAMAFLSVEYWVVNIVAFVLWWVFVNFVMDRWVFGPSGGTDDK